jgi:hypothetical protein
MKNIFGIGLLFLGFVSCKKAAISALPDYLPMTAGSTWTYQPSVGSSYTLTATNKDTVAHGKTFKVFTGTNGQNRYRMKAANEYYQLTIIPQLSPDGFAELFLKDNQAVGANWKSSLPVNVPTIPIPLTANLLYTIKAKDTTRTVSGKIFKKVVHVNLDVSIPPLGSVGGGNFYFADKVGLIESSMLVTMQGQQVVNQSEVLTSYSIK